MIKNKEYIINPSALSYFCPHCEYLKQNYNLVNKSISAGITGELDGIEKHFFLGDCRKITNYLEVMHGKNPPPPPETCGKCLMHKHFYDPKKLE